MTQKKWQYRLVRTDWVETEEEFDAHGEEGWELCCMTQSGNYYIFKRPYYDK